MKKLIFILIPSILLALFFILAYQYINHSASQKGALQVTSSPDSKVFLNGKYLGQTPLCKCEAADMIMTGDYTIRLVPNDTSLPEFQEKVTISEAVLTVVDRKFGKDSLSEGSVISLSPITDKKKADLTVVSFPQGTSVFLDNNPIGNTPLAYNNPTESDHVIRVKKNGYNDKTVRIRTPLGYKLTVALYLSLNPDTTTENPSPSPDSTVSPTSEPSKGQVSILSTPTGFLRVRDTASADGTELGQVTPGQSFPLVDEQQGWFKIRLADGTEGWISSQYAQKQ